MRGREKAEPQGVEDPERWNGYLCSPRWSRTAFSIFSAPHNLHGVVPHTMTWYFPMGDLRGSMVWREGRGAALRRGATDRCYGSSTAGRKALLYMTEYCIGGSMPLGGNRRQCRLWPLLVHLLNIV